MEGQVIAGYRIERTIGSGGMGIVFEGVHQHLGRRVAIKLLHDRYCHDRDSLSRFYNEARAASLAQHPCVIDVYEFGFTDQGQAYIVMELLCGCSLEKRLREIGGRMGTPCLPLVQKLAAGLSFLHERGIVHRDLKPDNVMLVPDPELPAGERVKLLDFGIAKLIGPQPKNLPISPLPTETGSILGTPAYLSPEQARGERAAVGPSADVYALGVMLYEMLAGTLPFERDSPMEMVLMHAFADPQPLQKRAPRVPRPVAAFVHRMLRKEPAARPTMSEVASELHRLSGRYLKADVPSGAEKHLPRIPKTQIELDLLFALLKRVVFREETSGRGGKRWTYALILPLLLLPGERRLAAKQTIPNPVQIEQRVSSQSSFEPMVGSPRIESPTDLTPLLVAQSSPVLWPLLPERSLSHAMNTSKPKRTRTTYWKSGAVTSTIPAHPSGPPPTGAGSHSGAELPALPPQATQRRNITEVLSNANREIPFDQ